MEASRTENNSLYLLFNKNTQSSELINLLNIIHNQATVDLGQMSLLPSRQQLVLFIRRRALDQSVAVRRSALQVPRSTTDVRGNIREGVKKKSIFLGNSPKQRTPTTHRRGLGLT